MGRHKLPNDTPTACRWCGRIGRRANYIRMARFCSRHCSNYEQRHRRIARYVKERGAEYAQRRIFYLTAVINSYEDALADIDDIRKRSKHT